MASTWRLPTVMLALSALIAGCSSGVESGADERAERAGLVMNRVRTGSAADMARRVVGGDPEESTAIEVLTAHGDRNEGRIVLRITERVERGDFSIQPTTAVRCYDYALSDSVHDFEPRRIDCPPGPAIRLDPPSPTPTLVAGIDDALRLGLEVLDPAHRTEETVLELARSVGAGAPVIDAVVRDGVIGVVVGDGARQCVAGSVDDAGGVTVWRVPEVVAQPGELGCSASAAARGQGTRDPH
jgi:hypothetical protein